jgi:hypothetical protein
VSTSDTTAHSQTLAINDIGAARGTNTLQFIDQRDGDPLAAVCLRHRKIVNVDFAPGPLEFFEFIGRPTSWW